jgi:hypothetical protein
VRVKGVRVRRALRRHTHRMRDKGRGWCSRMRRMLDCRTIPLGKSRKGKEEGWGAERSGGHAWWRCERSRASSRLVAEDEVTRGWLEEVARGRLEQPIGVVQHVLADGPAKEAGLEEGDVIVALGSVDAGAVERGGGEDGLFAAIADEVASTAVGGGVLAVKVVRRGPHFARQCWTFDLRPRRWYGDGLLGMRIAHLPAASST